MGEVFDELTKAVAKGVGRRRALGRLGLGLVGAMAASIGMTTPEAKAAPKRCMDCCQAYTGRLRGACLHVCNTCPGACAKLCFNSSSQTFACCASNQACNEGLGVCY